MSHHEWQEVFNVAKRAYCNNDLGRMSAYLTMVLINHSEFTLTEELAQKCILQYMSHQVCVIIGRVGSSLLKPKIRRNPELRYVRVLCKYLYYEPEQVLCRHVVTGFKTLRRIVSDEQFEIFVKVILAKLCKDCPEKVLAVLADILECRPLMQQCSVSSPPSGAFVPPTTGAFVPPPTFPTVINAREASLEENRVIGQRSIVTRKEADGVHTSESVISYFPDVISTKSLRSFLRPISAIYPSLNMQPRASPVSSSTAAVGPAPPKVVEVKEEQTGLRPSVSLPHLAYPEQTVAHSYRDMREMEPEDYQSAQGGSTITCNSDVSNSREALPRPTTVFRPMPEELAKPAQEETPHSHVTFEERVFPTPVPVPTTDPEQPTVVVGSHSSQPDTCHSEMVECEPSVTPVEETVAGEVPAAAAALSADEKFAESETTVSPEVPTQDGSTRPEDGSRPGSPAFMPVKLAVDPPSYELLQRECYDDAILPKKHNLTPPKLLNVPPVPLVETESDSNELSDSEAYETMITVPMTPDSTHVISMRTAVGFLKPQATDDLVSVAELTPTDQSMAGSSPRNMTPCSSQGNLVLPQATDSEAQCFRNASNSQTTDAKSDAGLSPPSDHPTTAPAPTLSGMLSHLYGSLEMLLDARAQHDEQAGDCNSLGSTSSGFEMHHFVDSRSRGDAHEAVDENLHDLVDECHPGEERFHEAAEEDLADELLDALCQSPTSDSCNDESKISMGMPVDDGTATTEVQYREHTWSSVVSAMDLSCEAPCPSPRTAESGSDEPCAAASDQSSVETKGGDPVEEIRTVVDDEETEIQSTEELELEALPTEAYDMEVAETEVHEAPVVELQIPQVVDIEPTETLEDEEQTEAEEHLAAEADAEQVVIEPQPIAQLKHLIAKEEPVTVVLEEQPVSDKPLEEQLEHESGHQLEEQTEEEQVGEQLEEEQAGEQLEEEQAGEQLEEEQAEEQLEEEQAGEQLEEEQAGEQLEEEQAEEQLEEEQAGEQLEEEQAEEQLEEEQAGEQLEEEQAKEQLEEEQAGEQLEEEQAKEQMAGEQYEEEQTGEQLAGEQFEEELAGEQFEEEQAGAQFEEEQAGEQLEEQAEEEQAGEEAGEQLAGEQLAGEQFEEQAGEQLKEEQAGEQPDEHAEEQVTGEQLDEQQAGELLAEEQLEEELAEEQFEEEQAEEQLEEEQAGEQLEEHAKEQLEAQPVATEPAAVELLGEPTAADCVMEAGKQGESMTSIKDHRYEQLSADELSDEKLLESEVSNKYEDHVADGGRQSARGASEQPREEQDTYMEQPDVVEDDTLRLGMDAEQRPNEEAKQALSAAEKEEEQLLMPASSSEEQLLLDPPRKESLPDQFEEPQLLDQSLEDTSEPVGEEDRPSSAVDDSSVYEPAPADSVGKSSESARMNEVLASPRDGLSDDGLLEGGLLVDDEEPPVCETFGLKPEALAIDLNFPEPLVLARADSTSLGSPRAELTSRELFSEKTGLESSLLEPSEETPDELSVSEDPCNTPTFPMTSPSQETRPLKQLRMAENCYEVIPTPSESIGEQPSSESETRSDDEDYIATVVEHRKVEVGKRVSAHKSHVEGVLRSYFGSRVSEEDRSWCSSPRASEEAAPWQVRAREASLDLSSDEFISNPPAAAAKELLVLNTILQTANSVVLDEEDDRSSSSSSAAGCCVLRRLDRAASESYVHTARFPLDEDLAQRWLTATGKAVPSVQLQRDQLTGRVNVVMPAQFTPRAGASPRNVRLRIPTRTAVAWFSELRL